MRITSLTATPVTVPLRHAEVWAWGRRESVDVVLVQLATDNGVVGVGEAAAYPTAGIVNEVFESIRPMVIGHDPFRIEHLTRRVSLVGTWHHMGFTSPALAAVEMACWDIIGKVCGQPLVNLLGGRVRDSVESMYYVSGGTLSELTADAARGAEAGFGLFYVKATGDNVATDVATVSAVREAISDDARVRVDANESWSSAAAIETLSALREYGLELAEQPVSGRNLTEMAYVRSRVDTPLLANEASWNRYDQLEVVRAGAADAVSVDNQMDGGVWNVKHAASMCEAAGVPVVKHSLGELGVAAAAATHLIASTPNFLYANQYYLPRVSDDVVTDATRLRFEHGHVGVPDGPGLGVELHPDKVSAYAEEYVRRCGGFGSGHYDERTPALPKR